MSKNNFSFDNLSKTYVAHVKRDLQVVYEAVIKFRKQVEYVKDVVARDSM